MTAVALLAVRWTQVYSGRVKGYVSISVTIDRLTQPDLGMEGARADDSSTQ